MFNRRTVLALGLTLAGCLPGALPAAADALADIQGRGTLRVAVPQDFPPFGSVGSDMSPQGYDIDMAKLLADKLGVKLALTPVTSTNRIPYLQTGKVDIVISTLGKSPEREKVIDFSTAYAPFLNALFGPADIKAPDAASLAGKTIGVTRGAFEDLELTKIAPADATIKRYEDNNGTISAFLSGQVGLVATGNFVAAAILARNPPKRPELKFVLKESACFVGLPKDQAALKSKIDDIIAQAKKDGSLNAISQKWLKADLPANI